MTFWADSEELAVIAGKAHTNAHPRSRDGRDHAVSGSLVLIPQLMTPAKGNVRLS
jgi:hypothetical protein